MDGIIGNSVISRLILNYLDTDSLLAASKVNTFWHEVIMENRSLWIKHLTKVKNGLSQERKTVWMKFIGKIEKEGSTNEIDDLPQIKENTKDIISLIQILVNVLWFDNHPLMVITKNDNLQLFKAFVRSYSVDLNQPFSRSLHGFKNVQPICYVIRRGAYEIAKYTLPLLKDKNPCDRNGITAMEWAIQKGELKIIQLLIPHIPKDSDFWKKPLIYDAVQTNKIKIVKYLLPLVVDKNPSKHNNTAIERAIHQGNLEIVQNLCSHISQDSEFWKKPLIWDAVEANKIEIVKYLLPLVVDKNPSKYGKTATEIAISHGNLDLLGVISTSPFDFRQFWLKNSQKFWI